MSRIDDLHREFVATKRNLYLIDGRIERVFSAAPYLLWVEEWKSTWNRLTVMIREVKAMRRDDRTSHSMNVDRLLDDMRHYADLLMICRYTAKRAAIRRSCGMLRFAA